MAKVIYRATAPDGTHLSRVASADVEHSLAVLGLMRLRKALPKINPDDPNEAIRYDRHKAWVMVGTVADERGAQTLISCQGYKGVTEETVVVPVSPEHLEPTRPAPAWLRPQTLEQEVEV